MQCLSDDVDILPRHQFRSVNTGKKDFGDLLATLLLKLNRRDVIKIEIGFGLLEIKKPCHLSVLLRAPPSVKRSNAAAIVRRSSPTQAIDQAGSPDTLHLQ